jgi:hypothetical protein
MRRIHGEYWRGIFLDNKELEIRQGNGGNIKMDLAALFADDKT